MLPREDPVPLAGAVLDDDEVVVEKREREMMQQVGFAAAYCILQLAVCVAISPPPVSPPLKL